MPDTLRSLDVASLRDHTVRLDDLVRMHELRVLRIFGGESIRIEARRPCRAASSCC